MPQLRIVKKTNKYTGEESFQIQKKWFLLGWCGVEMFDDYPMDTFSSLEEAKRNMARFDGSRRRKDEVVWP